MGPGSIPGQCEIYGRQWHWDRFPSEYFGIPVSLSLHKYFFIFMLLLSGQMSESWQTSRNRKSGSVCSTLWLLCEDKASRPLLHAETTGNNKYGGCAPRPTLQFYMLYTTSEIGLWDPILHSQRVSSRSVSIIGRGIAHVHNSKTAVKGG